MPRIPKTACFALLLLASACSNPTWPRLQELPPVPEEARTPCPPVLTLPGKTPNGALRSEGVEESIEAIGAEAACNRQRADFWQGFGERAIKLWSDLKAAIEEKR